MKSLRTSFPYSERSSLLPVSFWKRALATAAIPLMGAATLRAQIGTTATITSGADVPNSQLSGTDYSLGYTPSTSDTRDGNWTFTDSFQLTVNNNSALILGDTVNTGGGRVASGTLTQQGQSILQVAKESTLYLGSYGKGIYNLNGGTLKIGGNSLKTGYDNQAGGSGKFDPKSTGAPGGGYEFNLGGGTIETTSDLTTAVNASLIGGTVSKINTTNGDATWNGSFSGSGTLVKTGARTLNLSGSGNDFGTFAAHQGSTVQTRGSTLSGVFYVGSKFPVPSLEAANASFTLAGGSLKVSRTLFVPVGGGEPQPTLTVGDAAGDIGVMNQKAGTTVTIQGAGAAGGVRGANLTIGAYGGTGTYNLEGGVLSLEKSSMILGRDTGAKGLLAMTGGALNLTNGSLMNVGAGTGLITQTGGVITVDADSSFTPAGAAGATYDLNTGGTLKIGGTSLAAGGNLGHFNLGGGTIRTTSDLTTSVNANLVADTVSTIDTTNGDAAWSGNFSGTGKLTKTGTGTLTLSGSGNRFGAFRAHQGDTVQTAGDTVSSTFQIGSSDRSGLVAADAGFTLEGGTVTIAVSDPLPFPAFQASFLVGDASVDTGVVTQKDWTKVNITGTAGKADDAYMAIGYGGTGTYHLDGGDINLDHSGLILGRSAEAKGLLEMKGGSVNLTNGASLYTGAGTGELTQTGGDINVDATSTFVPAGPTGATYNLDSGGTLKIGGTSLAAGVGTGKFNLGGGTIVVTSPMTTAVNATLVAGTVSTIDTTGGDAAWSGNLSGDGGLNKIRSGTLTLSGKVGYTGTTTVSDSGSTLRLKDAFSGGSLAAATGANRFEVNAGAFLILEQNETSGTFGRNVQGDGQLQVLGSGNLTLTGTNTHTGGTIIGDPVTPGGTVTLSNAAQLGAGSGEVIVNKSTLNILGDGAVIGLSIGGRVSGGLIKANGTLVLGGAGHQIDTRARINADGNDVFLLSEEVYRIGSQSASVRVGGITLATRGRVIAPSGGMNVLSDGLAGTPSAVIRAGGSAIIEGKVVAGHPLQPGDPVSGDDSGHVLIQGPTASGEQLRFTGPLFGNYIITGNTSLAAGSSPGFSAGLGRIGSPGMSTHVDQNSPLVEVWGTDRGTSLTGYDATDVVDGDLNYSGVITVTFAGGSYSPAAGDIFDLVRLSDSGSTFTASGATFNFSGAPLPGGLSWDTSDFFSNANGDLKYTIAVVPETSASALLLLSAAVGLAARRRR